MIKNPHKYPPLDSEFTLLPSDIESYQKNGFIILRGVLSGQEISAWRQVLNDQLKQELENVEPLRKRDTYGKAFVQVMHLWQKFESVQALTFSKRLGGIIGRLMRVSSVRLMHDQILYKEPGGGYTPWHQDQYYIPLDTYHVATLWMPLVPVTKDMGVMSWVAGVHEKGLLFDSPTSDDSETFYRRMIDSHRRPVIESEGFDAGDLCIHSGWTPHCAGPNSTDRMREIFNCVYYADGAKIVARGAWEGAVAGHLGNRQPGQTADSEMNPVVWQISST